MHHQPSGKAAKGAPTDDRPTLLALSSSTPFDPPHKVSLYNDHKTSSDNIHLHPVHKKIYLAAGAGLHGPLRVAVSLVIQYIL